MLTTITAIAGLFFGLCGFTLGVLNYRRDRAKVLLSLDWHGCIVRQTDDLQAKLGRIYLTNTGRRPVYIVSVGLLFFTLSKFHITRTTFGHVKGFRLSEGDPPVSLVVPDSVGMAKFLWVDHKEHWLYLRAFAYDSTGKRYLSGKPKRRPFWGVGNGKIGMDIAESIPNMSYECSLKQHELEQGLADGTWHVRPLDEILDIENVREEHESWPARLRGIPVSESERDR